jgi:hypothetical protein
VVDFVRLFALPNSGRTHLGVDGRYGLGVHRRGGKHRGKSFARAISFMDIVRHVFERVSPISSVCARRQLTSRLRYSRESSGPTLHHTRAVYNGTTLWARIAYLRRVIFLIVVHDQIRAVLVPHGAVTTSRALQPSERSVVLYVRQSQQEIFRRSNVPSAITTTTMGHEHAFTITLQFFYSPVQIRRPLLILGPNLGLYLNMETCECCRWNPR